ncbi:MAG: PD-(D/E)XK motif protein [Thalassobaculaceae bacterium]
MPENAWSEIAVPTGPESEKFRRADRAHPFDFFRGRDFQGRHLFIFRSEVSDPGETLPNPEGIGVVHEPADPGVWQLKLTLSDTNQADIFGALCANLMEATRSLSKADQAGALAVILSRLRRWQNMLKAGRPPLLTQAVQMGLFGELVFLRDILFPRFGVTASVRGWRGPYGDEQDFAAGGKLIEVKTLRDTSDRRVKISSAEQLDTSSGDICLCVQSVSEVDEEKGGESLFSLASEVTDAADLEGPALGDTVRSTFHELGYEPRVEYATPLRSIRQRQFFRVSDGFPRLVPSVLPAGIRDVSYVLDVASLAEFETDEKSVWVE